MGSSIGHTPLSPSGEREEPRSGEGEGESVIVDPLRPPPTSPPLPASPLKGRGEVADKSLSLRFPFPNCSL